MTGNVKKLSRERFNLSVQNNEHLVNNYGSLAPSRKIRGRYIGLDEKKFIQKIRSRRKRLSDQGGESQGSEARPEGDLFLRLGPVCWVYFNQKRSLRAFYNDRCVAFQQIADSDL